MTDEGQKQIDLDFDEPDKVPPRAELVDEQRRKPLTMKDLQAQIDAGNQNQRVLSQQIISLNVALTELVGELKKAAPALSPTGASVTQSAPAAAQPDSMNHMLGFFKQFLEVQNEMKKGLFQDFQIASNFMAPQESGGDDLGSIAEALAPAINAYVQSKTGATNSQLPAPPMPLPAGIPTDLDRPSPRVIPPDAEMDEEDDEDQEGGAA